MKTAFVLRFQERCEGIGEAVVAGTQTLTNVNAEQMDSDPTHVRLAGIFQGIAPLAGTGTVTKANAEGADEDPQTYLLRAIPIVQERFRASTQTHTAVAAEGPDADPQMKRREFLSECGLF
jgi:hypothetical protein